MSEILSLLLWLTSLFIGAALGARRGHTIAGAALGLLGPIGWVIAAILPEAGPRCPNCGGVFVQGAAVCKCCGRDITPKQPLARAAVPQPRAVPQVASRPKPPRPLGP
jgi:hypothetical protein